MDISAIKGVAIICQGASVLALDALEAQLGYSISVEYRTLLELADGFSLRNGLTIYSSSDVAERNEIFEVVKYAPGYLAIGDDSGGRSILIGVDGADVFLVDQGSMDPDDFQLLGSTLSDWVLRGCCLG